MTQVFWDANFKVKSLEPVLSDLMGVSSPATMLAGVPATIVLPEGTKAIIFKTDKANSGNSVTIEVSKSAAPGPYVAELGSMTVDLDDGDVELSTENLTAVIVTNNEIAARDIPFVCLVNT